MKICIATTSFPRWNGDHRAPFIFGLAQALKEEGHAIRVATLHTPGALGQEVMDSIEVQRMHYLPERLEVLQKEDGGMPVAWKKYPLARLALLPFFLTQVVSIIRCARGCDLIHANWSLTGIAAWVGKFIHRKPYVVTVHGSDVFIGKSLPVVPWLTKQALNDSKAVIAVSEALAEALRAMGVRPEKIQVIPNGVNTAVFFPGEERLGKDLLFVGNITENKGLRYLLTAFANIQGQIPGVRMVIAGDGPERAAFEKLAQHLGIAEDVVFTGAKPQQSIAEMMRAAKVFVLPSLSEGFGVVLLEAMACGVPCIGTSVGGIPGILNHGTGLLVPPGDPGALGEAILRLIQSPALREEMRRKGIDQVACQYSWQAISKRILSVYQQKTS